MASANLAIPIYNALMGNAAIVALLGVQSDGSPSILTNRPVPPSTGYPMVISAADVTRTDQDLIDSQIPVIIRDVSIFGQNTGDGTRTVETLALMVRDLFHRQRQSLSVPGWNVLDIIAKGPFIGPTDDDQSVARIVTLTVRLS